MLSGVVPRFSRSTSLSWNFPLSSGIDCTQIIVNMWKMEKFHNLESIKNPFDELGQRHTKLIDEQLFVYALLLVELGNPYLAMVHKKIAYLLPRVFLSRSP